MLHQQDRGRTFEGDAYALAMGGETADETTDYCEYCNMLGIRSRTPR